MTIEREDLKSLAQAVADLEDIPERADEHGEASDALWLHMHCHTILGLIEEIERNETESQKLRSSLIVLRECFRQANETISNFYLTIKKLKDENEALKKRI